MNVTTAPRGIIQIDDARLIFRNFSGTGSKYNREGDRNFAVVIPDEDVARKLIADGWNVKIKPGREDGDDPFIYLNVKVKFNAHGPNVYLRAGKKLTKLSEDTIDLLDNVEIARADLDIRPYNWEVNGKTGISAYLESLKVTQVVDRFAEMEYDEDLDF